MTSLRTCVSSALIGRCNRPFLSASILRTCARNQSSHPPSTPLSNPPNDRATPTEVSGAEQTPNAPNNSPGDPPAPPTADGAGGSVQRAAPPEVEPVRWVQEPFEDLSVQPIVDEKGQYIVSRVQWPTGEVAYTTPPPPDGKLAPRFGYNVVQVRKDVSWWKHYHKYPRVSVAYINIQVLFLLGAAWLAAFLVEEYRRVTDEMKTPGAMVGEQRGRGSVSRQTQKVSFSTDEMQALVSKAQDNWVDGKAEASYVGSKEYKMKKIPRPKEFSVEDFRKR